MTPYRLDLTANVLRRFSTNVVDVLEPSGRYRRALGGFEAPLLLEVVQDGPAALTVTVKGPPGEVPRALAVATRMLGTDRDLRHWERRAARVPWLRGIAKRMRGTKPPRYPTLWEACVNAVVFQQVSLHAASAILRRGIEALGTRIELEGLRLYAFPDERAFANAADGTLRAAGFSASKVATLRRVADALGSGALDEAMLEERPSAEASALLCGIRGVGPWTAAVVLLRGLGRLDVFPMNDSGAARSLRVLDPDASTDVEPALAALGDMRGMLYYHLLLARLEASDALPAPATFGAKRGAHRTVTE
ncbi:MAG: DNA-3-methyladenine glycosylase 2 family protein [Candidatus Baltobacteraceae bacterium]